MKKNKGLEKALENNIEKRISQYKTPDAKKAAKLLVKSDLVLGDISPDSFKELPNSQEIIESLEKIKTLTAEGHLIKGNAYRYEKKIDKAIEDYNKAIELGSKDVYTYNNLAEAYIMNDDYENSLIAAQKSLEMAENIKDIITSKLLIVLSLILQGKGENEEKELIEYCNLNKGYNLTFEFETLKIGLEDSKYSARINNLIKLIEENAKST